MMRPRSEEPRPELGVLPNILVFCGPSGCGKSTLIGHLMSDYPGRFGFSVSHTTRAPRVGEINGVHYHFVDPSQMEPEDQFLEHAIVHGNHYGTSFEAINSVILAQKICILDIDVQGVDAMKKSDRIDQSRVVYVMLIPPSITELETRLRRRSTDKEEVIGNRLRRASEEIKWRTKENFWDVVLVNDDIEECYKKLEDVIVLFFKINPSSQLGTLSARKSRTD